MISHFGEFIDQVRPEDEDSYFKFLKFFHYAIVLSCISMFYKPFLLYIMNKEFRSAVHQIFHRENSFVSFENRLYATATTEEMVDLN